MSPPIVSSNATQSVQSNLETAKSRTKSFSELSENSQTAAEFINSQLQLEADAREALPYKFDACTRPLGPLRQLLFACLTCNTPPAQPSDASRQAAVCYSCSVQCHGEHTLVELFNKRNFVCDCGTTRLPSTSPCTLRINPLTNQKGGVTSESAEEKNQYNHNFQNRFCGCECDYDAHQQKGTMFQCLGLGTADEGGCGEDWWHPGCVVGLAPTWYEEQMVTRAENHCAAKTKRQPTTIPEGGDVLAYQHEEVQLSSSIDPTSLGINDDGSEEGEDDEFPTPPGFPDEDEFDGFICYKCVDANPWIKRYAASDAFLPPVFKRSAAPSPEAQSAFKSDPAELKSSDDIFDGSFVSTKRKADETDSDASGPSKRVKKLDLNLNEKSISTETTGTMNKIGDAESMGQTKVSNSNDRPLEASVQSAVPACSYKSLPPAPVKSFSLFFKSDFRSHLCRCPDCFPELAKHPQLLEEEEAYEPPVSEDGEEADGSTVGSGSLLDRGERALTNVDRVRAIEGVMAYNHLKEKLKPFFKEFAESGKAISAEDIKAHFAKMRGDEDAIKEAGEAAASSADNRREQSGY